jgi:hypothetical protein
MTPVCHSLVLATVLLMLMFPVDQRCTESPLFSLEMDVNLRAWGRQIRQIVFVSGVTAIYSFIYCSEDFNEQPPVVCFCDRSR